jgi:hypothetical protein
MANALSKYAYPDHAGMEHDQSHNKQDALGNALQQWLLGVKERTLNPLEALAQAAGDIRYADPVELGLNWSNPVAGGLAGIFAGVGAKTADVAKLGLAQKLKQAGVPDREIHAQTGWTFGFPDGKPRFEISDDAASLTDSAKSRFTPGTIHIFGEKYRGNVPTTMAHDDLVSAYPQWMRDIEIRESPKLEGGDFMASESFLDPTRKVGIINVSQSGSHPQSTLLHELQHAIQEREGFARGGSPDAMNEVLDNAKFAVIEKEHDSLLNRFNELKNKYEYDPNIPQNVVDEINAIKPRIAQLQAQGLNFKQRMGAGGIDYTPQEKMDAYQRLAGEAEARLTQARMNMTSEQRLHSYPLDMMDVPVEQQIVRYGDGTAMSAPIDAFMPGTVERQALDRSAEEYARNIAAERYARKMQEARAARQSAESKIPKMDYEQ